MKVKIIGDKRNGFDGLFTAVFTDDENEHKLFYDLDYWKGMESGMFGGNYIQIVSPIPMQMTFDEQYDMSVEEARKVYNTLTNHGWKPIISKEK